MTAHMLTETQYEELSSRESNGIRVSLVWNRADDTVKVSVYDARSDSSFDLDVGNDPPLEVYNHPFAYAAFRGVDCAPAFAPDEELLAA
jgi:hypothetical protein